MKVGFIGLGAMGRAMAANVLKAGHEVTVWNRSPQPAEALQALGATIADTPAQAAQSEVLLSMLANDQAVREVLLDAALLDAMGRGAVHVNHATISLALARELAAAHASRGLVYVAAPVFGRPDIAAAAKLNILAAGEAAAVQRVQPLLEAMGGRIWQLGERPEQANVAKLAGNFMLVTAIESMAEAAALTRAHGVPAEDFLAIMTSTLFASPVYQGYGKAIAERRYEPPGFALALGHKDVALALAAGADGQVPLPLAEVLRDSLQQAIAAGDGGKDLAALAETAARRAHLERRES